VKKLVVSFAIFAALALPGVVKADTITFAAPATAPNTSSASNNPNNPSTYEGGANQFDLDHHNAYTWQINNVSSRLPAGQTITGARITFTSIANWDGNVNKLFVHMLDQATNFSSATSTHSATGANGVTTYFGDATGSPVPQNQISDMFAGQGTKLFEQSFSTTPSTFTYNFTMPQLQALISYIAMNNNLAFGFDPDCHYWNNGIKFEIITSPSSVPEPATMTLLGTGLASLYYRRRRQQQQRVQQ
jgi:chitodextrinase